MVICTNLVNRLRPTVPKLNIACLNDGVDISAIFSISCKRFFKNYSSGCNGIIF